MKYRLNSDLINGEWFWPMDSENNFVDNKNILEIIEEWVKEYNEETIPHLYIQYWRREWRNRNLPGILEKVEIFGNTIEFFPQKNHYWNIAEPTDIVNVRMLKHPDGENYLIVEHENTPYMDDTIEYDWTYICLTSGVIGQFLVNNYLGV